MQEGKAILRTETLILPPDSATALALPGAMVEYDTESG